MCPALCAGENMRLDRSRPYQRDPGDCGYGDLLIRAGTAPWPAGHLAGRIYRKTGRSRQSDCGPRKDESERQSCHDLAQHLLFLALSGAEVESTGQDGRVDGGMSCAYQWWHLMDFFRHCSFRILCALFAFFLVSDIVADAIHDASGACATESQSSGHDSCPACACSIHTASAVAPDVAVARFAPSDSASESLLVTDDRPALGTSPAIDHPPQLS
jgi:hypothetical protein